MSSFFKELKDRRLVQIVVSYAAAGWIAMEVVSQFVERGVLSEVVYFVALVLYAGGLAWAGITGWFHGENAILSVPAKDVFVLRNDPMYGVSSLQEDLGALIE